MRREETGTCAEGQGSSHPHFAPPPPTPTPSCAPLHTGSPNTHARTHTPDPLPVTFHVAPPGSGQKRVPPRSGDDLLLEPINCGPPTWRGMRGGVLESAQHAKKKGAHVHIQQISTAAGLELHGLHRTRARVQSFDGNVDGSLRFLCRNPQSKCDDHEEWSNISALKSTRAKTKQMTLERAPKMVPSLFIRTVATKQRRLER